MSEIKKEPRKRSAFGPFYASEELVAKASGIPEIAQCITGTDKVAAIIRGFDFLHEWKDKVARLESGGNTVGQATIDEYENRIAELKSESEDYRTNLIASEQKLTDMEEEAQRKDGRIAELETTIQQMQKGGEEAGQAVVNLSNRIDELEAELKAARDAKPTWESIRKTLDPVYADMMERVAADLGQESPLMMAVDIFAKYHILRLTELPFQPFISEAALNEIILSHYPESGGLRELQKRLR